MAEILSVTIEKIIAGGRGLARLADGQVVMVDHVLADEEVEVAVRHRKKSYLEADLIRVLTPAPARITPTCRHYPQCGGCHLQEIDYPTQVEIKESILGEHLARCSSLTKSEIAALDFDFIPSPISYHYRQRLRLQVDAGGGCGFFQARSHTLERVSRCLLAEEPINQAWEFFSTTPHSRKLLAQATAIEFLFSSDDERIVIILHYKRKPRAADLSHVQALLAHNSLVKSIFIDSGNQGRVGPLVAQGGSESEAGLINFSLAVGPERESFSFSLEAGGFCQVNRAQNENMLNTVWQWIDSGPKIRLLDLYCGMGNFSIPLASKVREVVGMELQRSSIRSAKRNAMLNGITNCRFIRTGSEQGAAELAAKGEYFNCILMDPPRSGCHELIPYLKKLAAPMIIYISCDPATMSRDFDGLLAAGYRLKRICGVDMFPQTHHIEAIAQLELTSSTNFSTRELSLGSPSSLKV